MDEVVRALVVGRDEPEALVVVEPLHGAGRHVWPLQLRCRRATRPAGARERTSVQRVEWRLTRSQPSDPVARVGGRRVSAPGPQSIDVALAVARVDRVVARARTRPRRAPGRASIRSLAAARRRSRRRPRRRRSGRCRSRWRSGRRPAPPSIVSEPGPVAIQSSPAPAVDRVDARCRRRSRRRRRRRGSSSLPASPESESMPGAAVEQVVAAPAEQDVVAVAAAQHVLVAGAVVVVGALVRAHRARRARRRRPGCGRCPAPPSIRSSPPSPKTTSSPPLASTWSSPARADEEVAEVGALDRHRGHGRRRHGEASRPAPRPGSVPRHRINPG